MPPPRPVDVVCIASWNTDLVCRVARPIARGETLMASSFEILPGGKGSNAAIACARQGARTALIARIGDDDFGDRGMALWRDEGIETAHLVRAAGERSGVAQILVYDDGDNSIAVAPGAGAGLSASHVDAAADSIRAARVVMASCEVPLPATLQAFRIARAAGVTTLLNPAPATPLPDELLALTDWLTPNETELRALAGWLTPNETELRALAGADDTASIAVAARALLARGVGAVAVTLGSRGCALHRPREPGLALAALRVAVADTIGAGDTFTGALAAALARGEAPARALAWANAAAGLSVTVRGAISGMPGLEATAARLA